MRKHFILVAVLVTLTSAAGAQTAVDPNAPKSVDKVSPGSAAAPLAGANSFTEAQAKERIQSAGLTNVSVLTKDNDGIWRGTALKNGQPVSVAFDFKGNVVAK